MYDLKYNVLWFEDDERFIETKADVFEELLGEYGIDFYYKQYKGSSDISTIIESASTLKRWDLILVDYNLEENSVMGDELIHQIKKISPYCEILFYSNSPGFIDKVKAANDTLFEGVYFCQDRVNLDEKVNGLVELSLKRTQNVTYQRGIIIAYTIELSQIIDKIIIDLMKLNEKSADFYQNYVLSEEFFTDNQKVESIRRRLEYEVHFLEQKMKTVTGNKSNYSAKLKEIKDYDKILDDYQKKVIRKRNKFAHCKISPQNPNVIFDRKTKIEIDDNYCNSFRKLLKEQESKLNELSNYIHEKLEELS